MTPRLMVIIFLALSNLKIEKSSKRINKRHQNINLKKQKKNGN